MATRKAACLEAKPCVLGRLRRRKSLPLGGGGGPSGIRKQDAIYERHLVRTQRNESAVAVTVSFFPTSDVNVSVVGHTTNSASPSTQLTLDRMH